MSTVLGILGGMGPLASAEFVKTIYEFNAGASEQAMPPCILYSDPSMPDRTTAILEGSDDELIRRLTAALEQLSQLGIAKIVIPCITAHYFLPKIPAHVRAKVVSIIDLTIEEVARRKEPHLLLCTSGTRQVGIFQNHPDWQRAAPYVILPNAADQHQIHSLIYRVKQTGCTDAVIAELDSLLQTYATSAFIAGCTEIHLLTKHLITTESGRERYQIVDPLLLVATNLNRVLT